MRGWRTWWWRAWWDESSALRRVGLALALPLGLAGCNTLPSAPGGDPAGEAGGAASAQSSPDGSSDSPHGPAQHAELDAGQQSSAGLSAADNHELDGPGTTEADPGDAWERLRAQMTIDRPLNERVKRELSWFSRNQNYVERMSERAQMYLPYILRETERRGMPVEVALLPIIESAYQPFAHSPAGASGIWQFIPSTGRIFGLKNNWWYDGRRDVLDSTRAAMDYLDKLQRHFRGDWLLAVAAYNWGEGSVQKAVRNSRAAGKSGDFWSLRVPAETGLYVPRWLAVVEIVAHPEKYGMNLPPLPDVEYFETVPVAGQIDLALAAEMAGIDMDQMYLLNAGFNRWATDPDGPHRVLLPSPAVPQFKAKLAATPSAELVRWDRHTVAGGQSLEGIATDYRVSAETLRRVNRLGDSEPRDGQELKVPRVPARELAQMANSDVLQARNAAVGEDSARSKTHVVRQGDSLWLIARRNGVTVNKLAHWNGLPRNAVLRPGQRLAVWRTTRAPAAAASAPVATASAPVATASHPGLVHQVRTGDSLWGIAHHYQISTKRLATTNGLQLSSVLRPGMKLRLPDGSSADQSRLAANSGGKAPEDSRGAAARRATNTPVSSRTPLAGAGKQVSYTVKRGDSLWEIARRFDVSVTSLQEWNSLNGSNRLKPGQKLDIYLANAKST